MELERRDFAIHEVRVDQDARSIEGYAAVFNSESVDLGGFIERINPGAFKRSIETSPIIHAFWNHDSGIPLGSTRSGKLTLSEDGNGLHFRLDPKRLTPAQIDAIADGDMRMSFGFSVPRGGDIWEERDGSYLRTLKDVDLAEVSIVATPAYPDTSAALRSLDEARKEQRQKNFNAAAKRLAMKADLALRKRGGSKGE